jgi:hypothetical protein
VREGVAIATYLRPWEAELARQSLDQAGIPAWVHGPGVDDPYRTGPVRLMVPAEWAEDAHLVLADTVPADDDDDLERAHRRPVWVVVVAAIVAVGLLIPAVPAFLWVPILALALFGLVLWQLVRPAPPHRD